MCSILVLCGQRESFTQEAREAGKLREQLRPERPLEEGTACLLHTDLIDLTFHFSDFSLLTMGGEGETETEMKTETERGRETTSSYVPCCVYGGQRTKLTFYCLEAGSLLFVLLYTSG